jgi:wyosine [tRNA(Phe)-imidazoG37] synthetase (radical SAM superfamily)
MINLIPPEGRRALKIEYILHVVATFSVLWGILSILIAVAHIPTYVLVDAQIKKIETPDAQYTDMQEIKKEFDSVIKRTTAVIKQVTVVKDIIPVTEIIAEIQRQTPDTIELKSFVFQNNNQGAISVQVQGIAPTRETLALFKSSIEQSKMFEEAIIPIADLVRDVDVSFVITINMRKNI